MGSNTPTLFKQPFASSSAQAAPDEPLRLSRLPRPHRSSWSRTRQSSSTSRLTRPSQRRSLRASYLTMNIPHASQLCRRTNCPGCLFSPMTLIHWPWITIHTMCAITSAPQTLKVALTGRDSNVWLAATKKQMDAFPFIEPWNPFLLLTHLMSSTSTYSSQMRRNVMHDPLLVWICTSPSSTMPL